MTADTFFDHQSPESAAKTDIVANFFAAWLNIIGPSCRGPLGYMELYAGPGRFGDGATSTPLRVLETIVGSPHAARFRVVLNEMDARAADLLKANVEQLPNISRLGQPPILTREEVDRDKAVGFLKYLGDFPSVLFVDPFGYKGVSSRLFAEYVGVGWGRDAVLFFNYKRINAALSNPEFTEHMGDVFGEKRAQALRAELAVLHPHEREARVRAAMEETLHAAGVKFIHRYDFEKRHDSLFFMSQNEKGLRTMKNIMKTRSTSSESGVPSFSFSRTREKQFDLFGSARTPIDDLRDDLLARFAGRTMTFDEIFREHHPGTNYVDANYRHVLLSLEEGGFVVTEPRNRRQGTFGPNVRVTFPKRG
jgi:three-Cys-motif partner protein